MGDKSKQKNNNNQKALEMRPVYMYRKNTTLFKCYQLEVSWISTCEMHICRVPIAKTKTSPENAWSKTWN